MIGLTLAVLYFLVLIGLGKRWQEAYLSSTRFMTGWSVVVALLVGSVVPTAIDHSHGRTAGAVEPAEHSA